MNIGAFRDVQGDREERSGRRNGLYMGVFFGLLLASPQGLLATCMEIAMRRVFHREMLSAKANGWMPSPVLRGEPPVSHSAPSFFNRVRFRGGRAIHMARTIIDHRPFRALWDRTATSPRVFWV